MSAYATQGGHNYLGHIHPIVLYEVRSKICRPTPPKHTMNLSLNTGDDLRFCSYTYFEH